MMKATTSSGNTPNTHHTTAPDSTPRGADRLGRQPIELR